MLNYFKNKVAKLNIKQDETSELIQLLREILYSQDEKIKIMDKDTTGSMNSLNVLHNTMMTTGIVAEINGNFTNYGLPCRHIFVCRKIESKTYLMKHKWMLCGERIWL